MQIAVLGSPTSWYVADLVRAAGQHHVIRPAPFSRISSLVAENQLQVSAGDVDLMACDAVLVRSMPPGSLEQIVFRMDALGQLETTGTAVFNRPRSLETAIDKFLTTAQLQAAGLAVPRTAVCQSADDALAQFEQLGGDAVVKPLFGGEGRGIARVSDPAIAWRVFKTLERLQAVFYLQEFVPHDGYDLRLLVLGKEVLGMRRTNDADWRTNVALGGTAEPLVVTDELATIARRAAAAVGASLAGVDVLPASDGRLVVLEVNAVPGWRALTRVTGVDVAERVLHHLEEAWQTAAASGPPADKACLAPAEQAPANLV